MAFFLGDPERGIGAHQDLAEEISKNAIEFSRKYWRWEDMTAYVICFCLCLVFESLYLIRRSRYIAYFLNMQGYSAKIE